MTQPNPSIALARAFVDELARHGIDRALISPGSRSASLAIAFEESSAFSTSVVLDERSAGFQAIGHGRASGRPAVCVSTSGTAVANYLPAVVEADAGLVPLILMSADRPPESRAVGANQTIEQMGLFGKRVRWTFDVGVADIGFDANAYWRTTVSQAVARAMGHGSAPGPVHLNLSFREPTVPVSDDGRNVSDPYPYSIEGRPGRAPWQASEVGGRQGVDISGFGSPRGLVLAGEGHYRGDELVVEAERLGWPVLATALSGLRGKRVLTAYHHVLAGGVPEPLRPDVVVSVGQTGPSDRLGLLTALDVPQIQIDPWGRWIDPRRHGRVLIAADPARTLSTIAADVDPGWFDAWTSHDEVVRRALDDRLSGAPMTGPGVARALSLIPWPGLVAASSMPIRDVDAQTIGPGRVIANRGASGIDGFVSTALGVAAAMPGIVALSGDLSFLHDVNALLATGNADLVLVVLDNNGGGLFDLLPQAGHAPAFEKLFISPHDLDLVQVAGSLAATSLSVAEPGGLMTEVAGRLGEGGCHVLVAPVDRMADLGMRRDLDEAARVALRSLG